MKFALPAAAALVLAACAQETENNVTGDEVTLDESAADNLATANLTMNSSPAAADQAINQTDQQSELGNAADDAAGSIGNSVE